MQRIGATGRRIIFYYLLPIIIAIILVAVDQITKKVFENLYTESGETVIIKGFFSLTCVKNTGAAWSFLANKSWGQTFLKILTVFAIIGFSAFFVYSAKKGKKWLTYAIVFMIGGTIGNFIDRLFMNGVIDFLSFNIFGYDFPVFNFADCFLVVGVIMIIIYFLFLDTDAVFKKKNKKLSSDGGSEGENAE